MLHEMLPGIKNLANFGFEPEIEVGENKTGDFNEIELREIAKLIEVNKELILQQLNIFYSGKPVKSIKK